MYDRHLLDAQATLDFVYEGVDLGVHRTVARKPGDMFGEYALA
jgi:hypothetical protein